MPWLWYCYNCLLQVRKLKYGRINCLRSHTHCMAKPDLEPKQFGYRAHAVMTQPCHLTASNSKSYRIGYILYSEPWMNPVILGLGNWKQWHSNIDPATSLPSVRLGDFNCKIQPAGQMVLGIDIESMILKGHVSVWNYPIYLKNQFTLICAPSQKSHWSTNGCWDYSATCIKDNLISYRLKAINPWFSLFPADTIAPFWLSKHPVNPHNPLCSDYSKVLCLTLYNFLKRKLFCA